MSNGVNVKKIAKYTTLAAAGLAVEPAMADVITSGPAFVPPTLNASVVSTVPINFGSGVGSVFQVRVDGYYGSIVLNPGPAGGDHETLVSSSGNDPLRLGGGYNINAGQYWISVSTGTGQDIAGDAGYWNGADGEAVNGFLGIRFSSSALSPGLHYGFLQLSYDNTPDSSSGTLQILGWAYETTAGASITTFDVSTTAVPEPATLIPMGLGLLALGAAGLRAKRRQTAA